MAGSRSWHTGAHWARGLLVGVGLTLALAAFAQSPPPVLHEYFDFDFDASQARPSDGFDGTSADSEAGAGNTEAERAASAFGGPGQSAERNSEYALDGDTSRPDSVGYSDPFTPSVPPFKRLYAFDSVGADFELVVADPRLAKVAVGGRPLPSDDQFFADMQIVLDPTTPVRIPSVGPGARVLAAQTLPAVPIEILSDSADNWFVRAQAAPGEYRLILHLAIDRDAFGSAFANVSWSRLARSLPVLPRGLLSEASEVLTALQLDHRTEPVTALAQLVEYFRGFSPSDAKFSEQGAALYRRIALSRHGVCRHRAFAFTVTALALGLPTRFVHNEAHAWVEVNDSQLWRRIDLGGAAGQMTFTAPLEAQHLPPRDAYAWPANGESGQRLANDAFRRSASASANGNNSSGASAGVQPEAAASGMSAPPSASNPGGLRSQLDTPNAPAPTFVAPDSELADLPPSHITVRSGAGAIRRGQRLAVEGRVQGAVACSLMRIDVMLVAGARSERVGTLVTGADGQFVGELVVPDPIPPGDYALRAVTPGNMRCGPGSSQ